MATLTQPQTTANTTGLQSKALTVTLSISSWSARKHDKKVTREVNNQHNAKDDAGRFNKMLVAKSYLETIQKTDSSIRSFHYENTLPWGDNGDRLLPSTNYFPYVNEINRLKSIRDKAVREFIGVYDFAVQDARYDLGGLFNQADYPSKLEIESKFKFNVSFMPLPDVDFRLDLAQTEINSLTLQVENTFKERINAAMGDAWNRIKEQLTHMKEKLSTKDAIFRNTLFENLRDIINLLPKLNVTGDANLNKICLEMESLLVDPDAVRTNSNLRAEKAEEVSALLAKFDGFFS